MVRKKQSTFAVDRTTCTLPPIANVFPTAFPPTVTAATSALIPSVTIVAFVLSMPSTARAAMTAAAEPEMTPQISPMTSLQNELTRFAFRSSFSASALRPLCATPLRETVPRDMPLRPHR